MHMPVSCLPMESLAHTSSSSDLSWVAFTAFIVFVKNSQTFQSIKKMENLLIALWLQDKPTPTLP